MKFILTFTTKADGKNQKETISRFLKTGAKPPAGARLLGRWTKLDFSGGYVLLESNDPKPLFDFALSWSDLMELAIVPVLEDEPLGDVLKKRSRK